MNYILTDKEPKLPLKYFEDISAIPHGSYNEKAISAFIADTAAKLGLYARVDERNNVVVKKPATPGYEHLPALLLQAHVDMVNEKNSDSDHDFTKDGLKLILEGNILRADGTTLGADDLSLIHISVGSVWQSVRPGHCRSRRSVQDFRTKPLLTKVWSSDIPVKNRKTGRISSFRFLLYCAAISRLPW